jgi:uncharacterized protein (TIGR03435 family)
MAVLQSAASMTGQRSILRTQRFLDTDVIPFMPYMRISGMVVIFSIALYAQQTATPLAFEAASIKPSQDAPGSPSGISESAGGIIARHVTLKRCVRGAYDVPETHVVGGPKWADQDRYYIVARSAERAGGRELMLMLQALLAERFKLVLHREPRTVSGYKLAIAKGGLKAPASGRDSGSTGTSTRSRIHCEGCTMAQLTLRLSEILRWPVVDATGALGRFDFKLDWKTEGADSNPAAEGGTAIFTALQEQLGLKLEAGKVAAEVLVIDSAEKPSEN